MVCLVAFLNKLQDISKQIWLVSPGVPCLILRKLPLNVKTVRNWDRSGIGALVLRLELQMWL